MITDPPRPPPPAYVSALQPPTAASLAGSSSGGGASASGSVYAASTIITGGDGEGEVDGARQWPPPLEPLLPVRAGCSLDGEGQASRHDTATQEGAAAEAQTAAGALLPEPKCLQDVCARVSGCLPMTSCLHACRRHLWRVCQDGAATPTRPCFPRPVRLPPC